MARYLNEGKPVPIHRTLLICLVLVATTRSYSQAPRSSDFVFHRITQGPIKQELTERGEILPLKQTTVSCQLRPEEGANKSSTLTWVIEDGAMVKKGDLLAKLDDARQLDALQKQNHLLLEKKSQLTEVIEERDIVKSKGDLEIEKAELAIRLIDLEIKEAKDAQAKSKLALQRRMAELTLAQHKKETGGRLKQAETRIEPAQQALQAAEDRLHDCQLQLQLCTITAPHDGMATYYINESSRFGVNQGSIEVGEPVKEGQRLITISDLSRFQVVCKVHESMISKIKPGMKGTVNVAGQINAATVSSIAVVASSTDWMAADVKVYPVRLNLDSTETDSLKPGMSAQVTILLAERTDAILIPIQAVREERRLRYCYVKSERGIEKRTIKTGVSNTQKAEVLDGLNVGDEVVMNPPHKIESKETRKPVVPDPKPLGVLQLRSIKPSSGPERRLFVERYGLTHDDMAYLHSLTPTLIAPVHQSVAEVRDSSDINMMIVPLLGATPEFASFHPSLLAGMEGRFLCDHDSAELANITVIGKTVADKLFPRRNPLGEMLRISGRNKVWTVVGILSEQQGDLDRLNEAVFLPYAAEQAYHGETVVYRAAGIRGAEAVPYTHILFQPADGVSIKQTARIIRSRLEATHTKDDWALRSSEDR